MPTPIPRPEDQHSPDKHRPTSSPWTAYSVILAVLLARIVYLVWLCPWYLGGERGYYWDWRAYLGWGHYEKSPGQAFLVASLVAVLGGHERAVRFPLGLLS